MKIQLIIKAERMLIWVPKQKKIAENNREDQMAPIGSHVSYLGLEPIFGIPYKVHIRIIRKYFAGKYER